jgi:energy-coupling factor transporter ATP-binding protein EcfA2
MQRSAANRLVLIGGQEGAGKTTLIKALGKVTSDSAAVDAEDIGQVSPCLYDDEFFEFLRRNIAWLVERHWQAGYSTVITGDFDPRSIAGDVTDGTLHREFKSGVVLECAGHAGAPYGEIDLCEIGAVDKDAAAGRSI